MRHLLLPLLALLISCSPNDRQEVDLSDQVVERPVDGVGHYIYALSLPTSVAAGEDLDVQMEWRTVGSVDPNARYTMEVILKGAKQKVYAIPSGANTVGELHLANWLSYDFAVPADFPAGPYELGVRLRDANRDSREVPLGYQDELKMGDGFYRLAELNIEAAL